MRQSTSLFTNEKQQEAIDCIHLIKQKLTQPAPLKEICRLRIRRILRPSFHRKLNSLDKLPVLLKNYIMMTAMFPLHNGDDDDDDDDDNGGGGDDDDDDKAYLMDLVVAATGLHILL